MTLFRGSKNATVLTGGTVATTADIAAALEDTIAAKNDAEAAQAASLVNLEKLNETYLGTKSSDPTSDNNGDPLTDGAIYYNIDNKATRVYSESATTWLNLDFTSDELNNINALGPIADEIQAVADRKQAFEWLYDSLQGAVYTSDLGSIGDPITDSTEAPESYIVSVYDNREAIKAAPKAAEDAAAARDEAQYWAEQAEESANKETYDFGTLT